MAAINGTKVYGDKISESDEFYDESITFTPATASDYIYISYGDGSGTTYAKNILLEEGSTATPYDQYGYISSPELVLTVTKNGTTVLTQIN